MRRDLVILLQNSHLSVVIDGTIQEHVRKFKNLNIGQIPGQYAGNLRRLHNIHEMFLEYARKDNAFQVNPISTFRSLCVHSLPLSL